MGWSAGNGASRTEGETRGERSLRDHPGKGSTPSTCLEGSIIGLTYSPRWQWAGRRDRWRSVWVDGNREVFLDYLFWSSRVVNLDGERRLTCCSRRAWNRAGHRIYTQVLWECACNDTPGQRCSASSGLHRLVIGRADSPGRERRGGCNRQRGW